MAARRIYQLAKEFECDEKKIIDFLTEQGIKVANRLSAVSDDTYKLLKAKLFAPPPPPPEPEPAPPPPPPPAPKVEEPAQVEQTPAETTKEAPAAPAQGGGKKKKKKKKKSPQGDTGDAATQGEEDESQEQEEKINPQINFDIVNAATQAVSAASLIAGNQFLKTYMPFKKRKNRDAKTILSMNMDVWGLLQYLHFDSPDSSPAKYWQAVNKLTTAAYKLLQEYGLKNRELLGEMRGAVMPVGVKLEPQEIFTDEENQRFEEQRIFFFEAFGHGMGTVNDNLYELKMHAEHKKRACAHLNFVDYLTKPDSVLETKVPMPFEALAETVTYSICSVPYHVAFYLENKERILKSIKNFFEWIDGYKKLKEQGADAAKLEKYLELEEKFFRLVEFMSFDNLVFIKKSKLDKPSPFDIVLNLLNEYRDNMDDPDAKRNFQYKVRGVTNIIYKQKEYIFLYRLAELEPGKDYRTPEMIAAAEAAKAAAEAEQAAKEQENPAEESGEA